MREESVYFGWLLRHSLVANALNYYCILPCHVCRYVRNSHEGASVIVYETAATTIHSSTHRSVGGYHVATILYLGTYCTYR